MKISEYQAFLNNYICRFLLSLPKQAKKTIVLITDIISAVMTAWLAFCIRLEEFTVFSRPVLISSVLATVLFLLIFINLGLYKAIYRYSVWSVRNYLTKAMLIYSSAYVFFVTIITIDGIPRSIGIIQPILLFICVGATRLIARSIFSFNERSKNLTKRHVVVIYGAGAAGQQLASGLIQGQEINLIGFIDDNPTYWKRTISGLPVYSPKEISELINTKPYLTDILLAIPSASRSRQREILDHLSKLPIHVRVIPSLTELAKGFVRLEDFREVEIVDVLSREKIEPHADLMYENIDGKVVLVTGAGGSIGSEICRQVLRKKPSILILYELNEYMLYMIERELLQETKEIKIIPLLGSILDKNRIKHVMQRFSVQTVYHAAAYKHVPMIERNPAIGVWNNIFGTLYIVEASCEVGIEILVLISTDKAVRPTSVMGCSKRVAELILQAKNIEQNKVSIYTPKLTMVRFGNVLGSSGSVVQLFRDQIKNGGPVTVTHPEVIRYFMTIPEAAELVIQAGALSQGGDVMILDMGEPVKIIDLAKKMIHLSGLNCKDDTSDDGDIEIIFTGLRAGEKLYEELVIGSNVMTTSHSRIMRSVEDALTWVELEPKINALELALKNENSHKIRNLLQQIVPEFRPEAENTDLLLEINELK